MFLLDIVTGERKVEWGKEKSVEWAVSKNVRMCVFECVWVTKGCESELRVTSYESNELRAKTLTCEFSECTSWG